MGLKISKAFWFLSIVILLATLLYVYASVPPEILVFQDGLNNVYFGKEAGFYACLVTFGVINLLVFLISPLFREDRGLRAWFNGLIGVCNVFFITALIVINTVNSAERFDLQRIEFLVYGAVGLIAVYAISGPIYFLARKFSHKPA